MGSIIKKIQEKGVRGIIKSIHIRFYNKLIKPFYSMHGRFARFLWNIFQLFPINRNLILFESEPDFCDNSWALYQYIKTHRPHYKCVWIVKNPREFILRKDNNTSFVTRYGKGLHFKTIFYYATARWNFYTHWTFQPYKPRRGQTVVNLWHGGYPIKASKVKNRDYFDWIISMGEEGKDCLAKYIGCPMHKILSLGQPRIDLLVDNIAKGTNNPFCKTDNVKKVIMWMPTFRASVTKSLSENLCDTDTGLPLLTTKEDLTRFDDLLKHLNVVVIAKIHHLQALKDIFKTKYSHLLFLTDDILAKEGIQLYEILGKSDALLTDYSTVVWDYLVVDKPVGFILDDIELYEKSCGFNVTDVKDLLKGEHIYNKQQLIQFIQHVLEEKDEYQHDRRLQIEKRIQMFPHGGNCKNITEYFNI